MPSLLAFVLAPFLLQVGGQQGAAGSQVPSGPPALDRLPVLSADYDRPFVWAGDIVQFTVRASDPGDLVDLRLLNPPPGLDLLPALAAPSSAELEVRWLVPGVESGLRRLVFEAGRGPRRARLAVDVLVLGGVRSSGFSIGDVTGDGRLDVVGVASYADLGNEHSNVGAMFVWSGSTRPDGPQDTTLAVPGADVADRLGSQGVHLVDVTGDGVLDVVAVAGGHEILVWHGGPGLIENPSSAPDARLTGAEDLTSSFVHGASPAFADVTGDGVRDIVASSPRDDFGGTAEVGTLHVWAGGPGLVGTSSATARLVVPGASASDRLGGAATQGFVVADLTGDGVLDVVAANGPGGSGVTAAYVWAGGPGLTGSAKAPEATLSAPEMRIKTAQNDFAGVVSDYDVVDVTADGILDFVVTAPDLEVGGVASAGAVYVWSGGPGLAGAPAPSATLTVPGASPFDELGVARGPRFYARDVTGDGDADLVVPASKADIAGFDNGAIYVFEGGALAGSVSPWATLKPTMTSGGGRLGVISGHGVVFGDVTGDGQLDVVSGGRDVDNLRGAIYLWAGGPGMQGEHAALARLSVPGVESGHQLGRVSADSFQGTMQRGVQLVDLDDDGDLDVLAGASRATRDGRQYAGALYTWFGGAGLVGVQSPTATLVAADPNANDHLGHAAGNSIRVADVTGDGELDLLAGTRDANIEGLVDTGAIHVWTSVGDLTGVVPSTARLAATTPRPNDRLGDGQWLARAFDAGMQLADIDGDRVLDVLSGSRQVNQDGIPNNGALYVWLGSPNLASVPPIELGLGAAALDGRDPGSAAELGAEGRSVQLLDPGRGTLEIFASATGSNAGGVTDAGALYRWTRLQTTPDGELFHDQAEPYDRLGL